MVEFEPDFERRSSFVKKGPCEVKKLSCLNPECPLHGKVGPESIIHNGFYRTRSGKRRRYPVRRVWKDVLFDERHALLPSPASKSYFRCGHRSGVSISAISRVEGIAWNTVARRLEKAAQVCRRFNGRRIVGFAVEELQADEIRTFTGSKSRPTWVFAAIEVWSRFWPRPSSEFEATGTHLLACATWQIGWISSVFP